MDITLLDTQPVGNGIWKTHVDPEFVSRFANKHTANGAASVLLANGCRYDPKGEALTMSGGNFTVLVVAPSDTAIIIQGDAANAPIQSAPPRSVPVPNGDESFLKEASWLPTWAQDAARKILSEVRSIDNGRLERGERNKFINRPRNFWTITAQPRAKGFAVTVYGRPNRFTPKNLTISDDRPGYSRFVIRDPSEVDEAIRLIKSAAGGL